MAQIKAAFFDIDGTLLPFHAKALPESTVQALAALRKNGVKTFIATGRPPVHLPYLHALDGIPFDGYVTMNGQYCYLADGTPLYSRYIDRAALRTLLPYIEKERISVGFVGKDFCLFNHINDLSRQFALDLQQGEGDVAARIESDDIYQLSAFLPEENEPEFLRSCPGCIAVRWDPDFCDILPAGGGKPNGLAHTLAHLGLTREQSIAFGDGGNDVTMLEYAGIGVAMGCKPETFAGLSGMGDLIVTCTSMHSRNLHAGMLIGRGKSVEEAKTEVGQVVEGINALPAACRLARQYKVEMPIVQAVEAILDGKLEARSALMALMGRSLKRE